MSARSGEIKSYFDARAGEVMTTARALVEAESPSGDAEGSRAVVGLLEDAARSCPALTSFERTLARGGYGEHLRASFFGGGATGEGALVIVGHTDTVHPRGSVAARPWREDGGRLYGPGVFDMKAACALAFEAVRACHALRLAPRGEVVILLTCDEETGSAHGGRELVEREARRARAVLVLEPPAPGARAKTARKGTGHYVVTAHGRPAHAGLEPEKGASAVLEIARQIERLHASGDAARGTTVNVGVVAGGTRSNVVAAEARAEVDVRFSTMDEARRVEELILNLRPFDERVRLSVEGEINRPPLERSDAVARLYETARACAALLGQELGEASVGGASDGNFAAAAGAAVLDGLGVPGDGAHAFHEHVEASAVAPRGALLAALVASL
ncbi:MAG TPA: M20 family metallopeptidase [Pyrinomonadaceae bacterium]|nr:M20 family metallopeptidase [Pyrinomonadaceae bacterium]